MSCTRGEGQLEGPRWPFRASWGKATHKPVDNLTQGCGEAGPPPPNRTHVAPGRCTFGRHSWSKERIRPLIPWAGVGPGEGRRLPRRRSGALADQLSDGRSLILLVSSCTWCEMDRRTAMGARTLRAACITVGWSRPPNCCPILGKESSVSSLHRYMAIWRAVTRTREREVPHRSSTVSPK